LRRRGVRMDAVRTAVRGRDSDVDQFSGQRIERTVPAHDHLQALPGAFQARRVVGQRAPKVVDEIRSTNMPDVVEDSLHRRILLYLVVRPKPYSRHAALRSVRYGLGITPALDLGLPPRAEQSRPRRDCPSSIHAPG